MPKTTAATSKRRHNPLEADLVSTGVLKNNSGKKSKNTRADNDEDEQKYVDAKASRNILAMSRSLIEEEENLRTTQNAVSGSAPSAFEFDPSRFDRNDDEDDKFENDEAWGEEEEEEVEEIEVDATDLETFNQFITPTMNEDPLLTHGWDGKPEGAEEQGQSVNLADLILAKIAEKEAGGPQGGYRDEPGPIDEDYEIPPKVMEVFEKIGMILSRYKSGPLPKPFKVLPQIPHWEDILPITQPESWTPNACYAATRIFASAKEAVLQRFMEMVILERVREDIHETKKLNVHLFNSLKKALYKPGGFFKGFLFPLAASGTCSLREAQIVAGVLTRVTIPAVHSGMAIKGLCEISSAQASQRLDCVSATNFLLKTLIEKRHALPFQALDALVFHFLRYPAFATGGHMAPNALPVIFHQCMLSFAQRYKTNITEDQREALLDLLLTHGHDKISPEIRRELLAGRGGGVPVAQPGFDGDDTMLDA
ncbi:Bystin-domain-containing protein [Neurospora hispaniola]|uniref:Bystin-domain-containing protein n=1 Tax=Neurospora hispaniola TaxID=588809 RepID=A0AAJ0I1U4_9PEZI|nr:Bystin-domain-containing protein [Neurospora hispaniola]